MSKRRRCLLFYGLAGWLALGVHPVHALVNCSWLTTTTNVCTTDFSGTTCTPTTYIDYFCFEDGGGGTGGGGGGGGTGGGGDTGGGGGGIDSTPPPNPFDIDDDGRVDCYKSLTESTRVTAFPLPTDKNLGGRYGGPNDGVRWNHNGIDVRAHQGDPVRAAQGGTVFEILTGQQNLSVDPNSNVNGNFVRIEHADGSEGTYLHLHTIDVAVGDVIVPGQVIGTANNTGHSFGDHLHYTHWIDRYSSPKVAADPEVLHGDC